MKPTDIMQEISHSLSDTLFFAETEVINSIGSLESINKTRRRYAA